MIELKICECPCHQKDRYIMHCVPCCELTGEKYIAENGAIDVGTYGRLKEKLKEKD